MRADDIGHNQAAVPRRRDRVGMVMRSEPHRRVDVSCQRRTRGTRRAQPGATHRHPRHRPVAGEAELAAGALRPLIDDAADGRGKGGMTRTVEDDLGHRGLARIGLACRLVIDRRGQAFERARPVERRGCAHRKGLGWNDARFGRDDRCRLRRGDRQVGKGHRSGDALRWCCGGGWLGHRAAGRHRSMPRRGNDLLLHTRQPAPGRCRSPPRDAPRSRATRLRQTA